MPKCNHIVELPCAVNPNTVRCTHPCEKKLPCGHNCTENCGVKCNDVCKEPIKGRTHQYKYIYKLFSVEEAVTNKRNSNCKQDASMVPDGQFLKKPEFSNFCDVFYGYLYMPYLRARLLCSVI